MRNFVAGPFEKCRQEFDDIRIIIYDEAFELI